MNLSCLTTSQLQAYIKYYARKLRELKNNYCKEAMKVRYTQIIERYATEYILRTGELPD